MKKYIKKLMKLSKLLKQINLKIYLLGYDNNELLHNQFRELLIPIFSSNKQDIYSKAYDLACDYLDSFFYGQNLCDFCDNKCGYRREYDIEVGCCRHYEKHKNFGLFFGEKLVTCEKLGKDGKCTEKCLACKLLTCDYIDKKGIKFKEKDIFPLFSTFNLLQRIYVKCLPYTSKDKAMKGIILLSFRY